MLRNVLDDYLANIAAESSLIAPFMALLAAMGFEDIHFVHGPFEFGKDVITKKRQGETLVQYVFQLKRGDMSVGKWRSEVRGQVETALSSNLGDPAFNSDGPVEVVLVLTGRRLGAVQLELKDFTAEVPERFGREARPRGFDVWDRDTLVEQFAKHGLEGVNRITVGGVLDYGAFFTAYGQVLADQMSPRALEEYSRRWLDEPKEVAPRLLIACAEAEAFASKFLERGEYYEAVTSYAGAARAVQRSVFDEEGVEFHVSLYEAILDAITQILKIFKSRLLASLDEKGLLPLVVGNALPLSYAVQCCRTLELLGLLYFLDGVRDKNEERQASIVELIERIHSQDPGTVHPLSDVFAVGYVPPVLALLHASKSQAASKLLAETTVFVCDRLEDGKGIAGPYATPEEELEWVFATLLPALQVHHRRNCLIATVLCDLAAMTCDESTYKDVLNDLLAAGAAFWFLTVPDTPVQFGLPGKGSIMFPNIEYVEEAPDLNGMNFGNHLETVPETYKLTSMLGTNAYLLLSFLMRDRYFPKLWLQMIRNSEPREPIAEGHVSRAELRHD